MKKNSVKALEKFMTLAQGRAFLAVAIEGSFTGAAKRLNLSQPSVDCWRRPTLSPTPHAPPPREIGWPLGGGSDRTKARKQKILLRNSSSHDDEKTA
jgi:hypothetical protein